MSNTKTKVRDAVFAYPGSFVAPAGSLAANFAAVHAAAVLLVL